MRILLISTTYNSLTQLVHAKLREDGHDASVTLSLSDTHLRNAVKLYRPEIIICPFLKEKIPADMYEAYPCIIIHPGIVGDRGPSSLDWAIINSEQTWGVTAIQATAEFDSGPIWGSVVFPMRKISKASIYRHEVSEAAVVLVREVVEKFSEGEKPLALSKFPHSTEGVERPSMKQSDRKIDWEKDSTDTVMRKMYAAESSPGVLDVLFGEEYYIYGPHKERELRGTAGTIIGKRNSAICRTTSDGAVWITHLKKRGDGTFKLPATDVLGKKADELKEFPLPDFLPRNPETFQDVWYEEKNAVGYLYFDFYNGAMGLTECMRLLAAIREAKKRPTNVLVFMGGRDFWSNGLYLHEIETAQNPGEHSWKNINAIDDFVHEMITLDSHITVSAVYGTAGAGGAMMSLASDFVWGREATLFNPHYRSMGLYGSEYWTYLLPRRVGKRKAIEITHIALPIGAVEAKKLGMMDEILSNNFEAYLREVEEKAETIARRDDFSELLSAKRKKRANDEATKPLSAYRDEELVQMKKNFGGESFGGVNYNKFRHRFVHKIRLEHIPPNLM